MVCSDERFRDGKKFPFDIQHRAVLIYKTEAPQDFVSFQNQLAERLSAMLNQARTIEHIAETDPVADVEGLSQVELTVLAIAAGNVPDDEQATPLWGVKRDVERAGLTNVGFSLGFRRLKKKGFVELTEMTDESNNYNRYEGILVTAPGWEWIEQNEKKFILHTTGSNKQIMREVQKSSNMEDDIPF